MGKQLRAMAAAGVTVRERVADDCPFLVNSDEKLAEEFGFRPEESASRHPAPTGTWPARPTVPAASSTRTRKRQARYTCGKYDEIIVQPRWEMCPAFGGGCSSVLFNEGRRAIICEIVASGQPLVQLKLHHRKVDKG